MDVNIANANISAARFVEQGSAPAVPSTGSVRIYAKSNGIYYIDDAGVEHGPFASTADIPADTDDQAASEVDYDNGSSGLSATNVQDALDEVASASSGSDPHAWTTEAVVHLTSSNAEAAVFPTSGVFDTSKEYLIEFRDWTLASGNDRHLRVDIGAGFISSNSYERAAQFQVAAAGPSSTGTTSGASAVSVISIASGSTFSTPGCRGRVLFAPGDQATRKAVFRVEAEGVNASGLVVYYIGVAALSTPTNAAIQRVQLLNASVNSTGGIFVLKSRPLLPSL